MIYRIKKSSLNTLFLGKGSSKDFYGGDGGIRTLDLTDANRTLSQLSYAPMDDSSTIIAYFFGL